VMHVDVPGPKLVSDRLGCLAEAIGASVRRSECADGEWRFLRHPTTFSAVHRWTA
jgi:hypothetical protein